MSGHIYDRRRVLGAAAMSLAAASFDFGSSALAETGTTRPKNRRVPSTSLGPLKQIDAGVLNIGYAEAGPATGRTVILLHGWPYDIHSFVEVAPLLARAGYRVLVPYVRGYGSTKLWMS